MQNQYKSLFELDPEVHYMNGAAYSPTLRAANQAGIQAIQTKASSPYQFSADHHFGAPNRVRAQFAQLINTPDPNRIAIIPAVSYGLAVVAKNLFRIPGIEHKKNILILGDDFPNNYYTFKPIAGELGLTLQTIPYPESESNPGAAWNQAVLEAINDETALVVATHVHWIKGLRFELENIGKACRQHGALFVVDGSQATGVEALDVTRSQPDAYITACYKWLLGPYGTSLAYFGPFFDDGLPLEESWMNRMECEDFSRLTRYIKPYLPGAQRYNCGEYSNMVHIAMIQQALEQINAWGVETIRQHSDALTEGPIRQLEQLGCTFQPESHRSNHLLGIGLPEHVNASELAKELANNRIYISLRGTGIRVSTHVYNTAEDWNTLTSVLENALKA
jgi:selenocysteine lyase/cysteine desulfurase